MAPPKTGNQMEHEIKNEKELGLHRGNIGSISPNEKPFRPQISYSLNSLKEFIEVLYRGLLQGLPRGDTRRLGMTDTPQVM